MQIQSEAVVLRLATCLIDEVELDDLSVVLVHAETGEIASCCQRGIVSFQFSVATNGVEMVPAVDLCNRLSVRNLH